jgi:hypothetical protein
MPKPIKMLAAAACVVILLAASAATKTRTPVLNMPHHSVLGTESTGKKRQLIRLTIHHPSKDFDASKTVITPTTDLDGTFSTLKIITHSYTDDDGNKKANTATVWLLYTPPHTKGGGTGTLTLTTTSPDGTGSTTVVTDPGYDPCMDCP